MANVNDSAGIEINGKQVADSNGYLYQLDSRIIATAEEINKCKLSSRIVNVTDATLTITAATHDSKIITLNKADGQAVTLPAATGSGLKITIIIGTTITSSATTIKVTGNDVIIGNALICNDTDASVSGFECAATSDTITFDGSTTGGIKGDKVELIDIATDTWFVNVRGSATGSEATPFSATVT